ncbi:MAG: TonB-dependent receptor [Pseudomonadales bacterium]|nr:TonB-dependent receptor [Pseudomonadales bacterium]
MKNKKNVLHLAVVAAIASQTGLISHAALSQTDNPVIEEIVITSTRRATNVQDTPLAVSALSGQALETQNIENTQDLTAVVPNVLIYGGGRGVTSGTFNMRGIPRVGTYVDGVWQVSNSGLLQRQFVELDRVEVLRGPQGTLVGRDSTGGSIQIFTKRPAEEFGAVVNISAGSFDRRDVSGSVDIPISDTLKTRWTLASYDKDGYVKSITTGQKHGELENQVLRGDIVWDPIERLSVRYIYQEDTQKATTASVQTFINPEVAYDNGWQVGIAEAHDIASLAAGGRGFNCQSTVAGCPGGDLDRYETTKLQRSPDEVWIKSHSLILDYELTDAIAFKYIYGNTRFTDSIWADFAGSEFNFFTNYDVSRTKYKSHEFQFNFTFDRANAVLGAFTWDQSRRSRGAEWSHSDWSFPDGWGGGAGGSTGGPPVPPGLFQTRNSGRPQTLDYQDVLDSPTCQMTPADRGRDFSHLGLDPNSVNGWPQPCTDFAAWVPLFATVVGFNSTNGIDGSDRSALNTQDGYAVFGEVTYDINERWDVTGGFRYHDQENKNFNLDIATGKLNGTTELRPVTWDTGFASIARAINAEPIPESLTEASFNKLTFRFSSSYDIRDGIMMYFGYSEGFNSGGIIDTEDSLGRLVTQFDPETIKNKEVGLRGDFFNRRLRANVTYFLTDWNDIQAQASVIDRGTGLPITEVVVQNAAEGEAKGLELELTYAATDNILLEANLGFLDTKYKNIKPGAQITENTEFGGAPKKTANLSAQYSWYFNGGASLMTRLSANYTGLFWRSPIPSFRQDAYGGNSQSGDIWRFNARTVFTPGDSRYEISAFVNNLTNAYFINSGFMDSIWQFDFSGLDAPREFGLSVRMTF